MKKFKKFFVMSGILCATLTVSLTTCYASTEMILNHGLVEFNELLVVENNTTFIPLRLAFNLNGNNENPGLNPRYGINVKPYIDQSYVEVSLRRKDDNGNLTDTGRYVKIEWADEVKSSKEEWKNGRMQFIKYDVVNGENVMSEWRNEYTPYAGLESGVKLIPVNETGDRLFLSVNDLQKIANFLTDGNNYQVDIIAE